MITKKLLTPSSLVTAALLGFILFISAAPLKAEEAPTAQPLMVGLGSAKLNLLLQPWFVQDSQVTAQTNFRLRRTEIKFSGSVMPDTRWFVMFDPAKSLRTGTIASTNDNKILQDLGVAYTIIPNLEFVIGQFKIPTTAEGLDSSAELLLPERSLVGRTYGDKREPGAMVTYKCDHFKISTMVSNGQSTNVDDTNNLKDFHARVESTPIMGISAGAFTTLGDYEYKDNGRLGANLRYINDLIVVKIEGAQGRTSGINNNGLTGEALYFISENIQPVLHSEIYNPNTDTNTLSAAAQTIGINYYFKKHNAKVQGAYSLLHNMTGTFGSYGLATTPVEGSLITVAFQMAI